MQVTDGLEFDAREVPPSEPESGMYLGLSSNEQCSRRPSHQVQSPLERPRLETIPMQASNDTQPLLPEFCRQCDPHAHLNDLAVELCAEISGFGAKSDSSTSEHRALSVSQTSPARSFLWADFPAGPSDLSTCLGGRCALSLRIEVVDCTQVEYVSPDGVVEHRRVQGHSLVFDLLSAQGR